MHPHTIERLGQGHRADLMLEARVRQLAAGEQHRPHPLHWVRSFPGALGPVAALEARKLAKHLRALLGATSL
jgi:hypothetical protein